MTKKTETAEITNNDSDGGGGKSTAMVAATQ